MDRVDRVYIEIDDVQIDRNIHNHEQCLTPEKLKKKSIELMT